MDSDAAAQFKEGARPGVLWAGLLASPVAALLQQQISYALVPGLCWSGREWLLHLVSFLALAVTVGAGLLSWRNFRAAGVRWEDDGGGVLPRSRLMAAVGLLISGHSALVVIGQWIAVFVYSTCER